MPQNPIWPFTKQDPKYGYGNNPTFVEEDEATDTHTPCGYWPEPPAPAPPPQ